MGDVAQGERKAPSLTGRFAAAIALTIGFYTLALLFAAALIGLPVYGWLEAGRGNLWVTITCLFLGGSILFAIFPRRLRFQPPGVRVDHGSQPQLLQLIAEEAKAMKEKEPDEVYATMEVNAAVTEVGRGRRVMIVGIPMLHLLSERGFRGVIAHELGHYRGGDTRLGPVIYRTREAIGRTIEQLSDDDGDDGWAQAIIRQPFIWYGRAFMRITSAISRREEFAADACAVERAGRDAHVEALRRIHAFAPAFDAYWQQDVVPALSSGTRPPLAEGFSRFAGTESVQQTAERLVEQELAEGRTHPYDSHPSLAERIAAVERFPAGQADDSPQAISLIEDPQELEAAQVEFLFGAEARAQLERIAWEDAGDRIYVPGYEGLVREYAWLVEDVTFASLPATATRLHHTGDELRRRVDDLSSDDAPELAAAVFGAAAVLALRHHGWSVEALPGHPVLCHRGEAAVAPHAMIAAMRDPVSFDRAQYDADLEEHGIAGIALADGVPADAAPASNGAGEARPAAAGAS
jgi:heat shock protein HtpX